MNNNSMKFLQLAAGAASLTALSGCTKDSSSTECAAGQVLLAKQCVDKCAVNKTFASETNSTCVDQCPEGKTFASATNTTCVDKKPELKKCKKTDDCKEGEECKDGKCQSKSKCPEKEHFDEQKQQCVPGTPPGPVEAGCSDLWEAVREFVKDGKTDMSHISLDDGAHFVSAYESCFTCMDQNEVAKKYVEQVDEAIKSLPGFQVETIHKYVKTLVEGWNELLSPDEQTAARDGVFAASKSCNGPDAGALQDWLQVDGTKKYLVTTTKAMTEEEYQDLINSLD